MYHVQNAKAMRHAKKTDNNILPKQLLYGAVALDNETAIYGYMYK